MLLTQFAKYVLRGQRQAIFVALLFTAIPYFNWVSAVVIGLVTLCKGAYEGFIILLWSTLLYAVFAVKGMWMPLFFNIGVGAFLVWVFALLLRRFARWTWVIEGLSLLAIVAVLVAHFLVPNIATLWTTKMQEVIQPLASYFISLKISPSDLAAMEHWAAYYATGVQAAYAVFTVLVELALARMLQARLLFPGELMREWLQFRLHYLAAIVLLVAVALAVWGQNLFKDIMPIVVLPFLIAGISLVHRYLRLKKQSLIWIYYLLLVLMIMFLPLVMLGFFVLLATLDAFLPIRKRLAI